MSECTDHLAEIEELVSDCIGTAIELLPGFGGE